MPPKSKQTQSPPKTQSAATNNSLVPPHYIVTVEGLYYRKTNSDQRADIIPYIKRFRMPARAKGLVLKQQLDAKSQKFESVEVEVDLGIDEYGVMSVLIRSGRLEAAIKKDDAGFAGLRTYIVTDVKTSSPALELPRSPHLLNYQQLKDVINVNRYQIDINTFQTLEKLREAVYNWQEDPESYRLFEDRERRMNGDIRLVGSLMDELDLLGEVEGEVEDTDTPETVPAAPLQPNTNTEVVPLQQGIEKEPWF